MPVSRSIAPTAKALPLVVVIALLGSCAVGELPPGPTPSPSAAQAKRPSRDDALRSLSQWIAAFATALESAREGEHIELPPKFLSQFNDTALLAEESGAPLPPTLITGVRELASASDRLRALLRSDPDYPNQVRSQRQRVNAVIKELQRAGDYARLVEVERLQPVIVPPVLVTLKPEQIIMPLSEFPLSSFKVDRDEGFESGRGWRRVFVPTSFIGANVFFVDVRVVVLPASLSPKAYFALQSSNCVTTSATKPTTSEQVSAAATGESSFACRHVFSGGDKRFDYRALSRNVYIEVSLLADSLMNEGAALDQAIAIARQQVAIMDRVARPRGLGGMRQDIVDHFLDVPTARTSLTAVALILREGGVVVPRVR